jgi:hypothetical protein
MPFSPVTRQLDSGGYPRLALNTNRKGHEVVFSSVKPFARWIDYEKDEHTLKLWADGAVLVEVRVHRYASDEFMKAVLEPLIDVLVKDYE